MKLSDYCGPRGSVQCSYQMEEQLPQNKLVPVKLKKSSLVYHIVAQGLMIQFCFVFVHFFYLKNISQGGLRVTASVQVAGALVIIFKSVLIRDRGW